MQTNRSLLPFLAASMLAMSLGNDQRTRERTPNRQRDHGEPGSKSPKQASRRKARNRVKQARRKNRGK